MEKLLKNICQKLGEKNSAVYTVVAVAVFKGIFRPIFTMMDKKQEPKSKKYAAIREGSTELIAIPTYIAMHALAEKFAPAFVSKTKSITGALENSKTALGFVGVCFAALVAIPGLCNMAMPHILKALGAGKGDKKEVAKPQVQPAQIVQIKKPADNTALLSQGVYKPFAPKSRMGVSL